MPTSGVSPVRAGDLRRHLTIQQSTRTPDGMAGYTESWTTVLTTWGSVKARSSSALLQLLAGQQMPTQAYDIIIRYPPSVSISAGMRIVDGLRTYYIANITDVDERHRIMQIACTQAPAT